MEKKSRSNFCNSFCIIGFPDEIGIQNVQGRLGAKAGPQSFFDYFQKLKGKNPVQEKMLQNQMVKMSSDLDENYHHAIHAVKESRELDCVVVVGGGHDYAYPWIAGMTQRSGKREWKLGCINLDAHFDLRSYEPKMTSGSPFRRLLDEGLIQAKNLIEFGIQDHCNSSELWSYARQQKIKTISFSQLRNQKAVASFKKALTTLKKNCDEVVISLDLDSLSLAYCPGVSAPQGEGFTASEVYQMLEIAGADKKVTSLGIFELSPPLDQRDQTSRVAAQAAWHFLNAKLFAKVKA